MYLGGNHRWVPLIYYHSSYIIVALLICPRLVSLPVKKEEQEL